MKPATLFLMNLISSKQAETNIYVPDYNIFVQSENVMIYRRNETIFSSFYRESPCTEIYRALESTTCWESYKKSADVWSNRMNNFQKDYDLHLRQYCENTLQNQLMTLQNRTRNRRGIIQLIETVLPFGGEIWELLKPIAQSGVSAIAKKIDSLGGRKVSIDTRDHDDMRSTHHLRNLDDRENHQLEADHCNHLFHQIQQQNMSFTHTETYEHLVSDGLTELETFLTAISSNDFTADAQLQDHLFELCRKLGDYNRCRDYIEASHMIKAKLVDVKIGANAEVEVNVEISFPIMEYQTDLYTIHNLGRRYDEQHLQRINLPKHFLWTNGQIPYATEDDITCDDKRLKYCNPKILVQNNCLEAIILKKQLNGNCLSNLVEDRSPSTLFVDNRLLIATNDEDDCKVCPQRTGQYCSKLENNALITSTSVLKCQNFRINLRRTVNGNVTIFKINEDLSQSPFNLLEDQDILLLCIWWIITAVALLIKWGVNRVLKLSHWNRTTIIGGPTGNQQQESTLAIEQQPTIELIDDYITVEQ